MPSNAVRAVQHRRSLLVGLSISAAAHLGALAVLTVPGQSGSAGPSEPASDQRAFPALEVVELSVAPETTAGLVSPPVGASSATSRFRPSRAAPAPGASDARAPGAAATAATPSLDALLGTLTAANPAEAPADRSRPLSPFKRLEAVAGTGRAAADAGAGARGEDENRSRWRKLLDGITISVGAGPYCPVRGGPLIMR